MKVNQESLERFFSQEARGSRVGEMHAQVFHHKHNASLLVISKGNILLDTSGLPSDLIHGQSFHVAKKQMEKLSTFLWRQKQMLRVIALLLLCKQEVGCLISEGGGPLLLLLLAEFVERSYL